MEARITWSLFSLSSCSILGVKKTFFKRQFAHQAPIFHKFPHGLYYFYTNLNPYLFLHTDSLKSRQQQKTVRLDPS